MKFKCRIGLHDWLPWEHDGEMVITYYPLLGRSEDASQPATRIKQQCRDCKLLRYKLVRLK